MGDAKADLLQTDRQWAAAAAAGDLEALVTFWADSAVDYFPNGPVADGREAIRQLVAANRSQPGFSLNWEPSDAVVADSGDLGYTMGAFDMSFRGPDNRAIERHGHYVCIWRKQPDGSWKCIVEMSNFRPG